MRCRTNIPASCGKREGALGRGDRLVMLAYLVEMVCQKEHDLSQPARVGERLGEGLGLAQTRQDAPQVAKRTKCRAQGEPQIDGLLACVMRFRQMMRGPSSACSKYSTASRWADRARACLPRLP